MVKYEELALKFQKKNYKVVRLSMVPDKLEFRKQGRTNFNSYTNFLVVNGTVFLPRYEAPHLDQKRREQARIHDIRAKEVIEGLGYRVVQIDAYNLINWGGAIHCLTKTMPLINE